MGDEDAGGERVACGVGLGDAGGGVVEEVGGEEVGLHEGAPDWVVELGVEDCGGRAQEEGCERGVHWVIVSGRGAVHSW